MNVKLRHREKSSTFLKTMEKTISTSTLICIKKHIYSYELAWKWKKGTLYAAIVLDNNTMFSLWKG